MNDSYFVLDYDIYYFDLFLDLCCQICHLLCIIGLANHNIAEDRKVAMATFDLSWFSEWYLSKFIGQCMDVFLPAWNITSCFELPLLWCVSWCLHVSFPFTGLVTGRVTGAVVWLILQGCSLLGRDQFDSLWEAHVVHRKKPLWNCSWY